MATPSALNLTCPACGEETPHRVLKGKVRGREESIFEGVVRCARCGSIRQETLREALPLTVPIIVSWLDRSQRLEVDLNPGEVVSIGDRLDLPEGRVEVTGIEASNRRIRSAEGREVTALWAKRMDHVVVKFSINKGNRTLSARLLAVPEEEFTVGDMVEVGRDQVLIHRIIKQTGGVLKEGSARAEDITRVYAKAMRHRGLGVDG